MDLKRLRSAMKADGWGKVKRGLYPRPYLWDYLETTHPEIINEYKKWFDEEVRD